MFRRIERQPLIQSTVGDYEITIRTGAGDGFRTPGVQVKFTKRPWPMEEGDHLGLLSPYRSYVRGQCLDYPRHRPAESITLDDGAVHFRYAPTKKYPAEFLMRFELLPSGVVEASYTVRANVTLEDYEVFVASYFSPRHAASYPVKRVDGLKAPEGLTWWSPGGSPIPGGTWPSFPRDARSAGIIHDGRYEVGKPPIPWCIWTHYAAPIGVMAHQVLGQSIALVSTPADCFAVSFLDDEHNAVYHHLFGRTIEKGTEATAKVRLLTGTNEQMRETALAHLQSWVAAAT